MSLISVFLLVGSPEAVAIVGKIEAAHKKMTNVSVFVSDGLSNVIPTKMKVTKNACTMVMPNQQIVEVKANSVRFFDQIFNQVATVKPEKPMMVPDSAPSVAIVQREPISWFVDSKQRGEFFAEMKRDSRWKVKGTTLILEEPRRKIRSEVHFDTSFRVSEIKLQMSGKLLSDWKYRYVKEGDVPVIPVNAKVVRGLAPRPTIPKNTEGKAVLLAQQIWRSMSRLDNRKVTQTTDDGVYSVTFGQGKLTETGPKGTWSVAGTKLVVTPKQGAKKTINGGSDKFLDALRASGMEASPVSRYILNRKIPFLDLFDRSESVQIVPGTASINGKTVTVLNIARPSVRLRLYVEAKTGDIVMISSDSQDSSGKFMSGSRIKISYQ